MLPPIFTSLDILLAVLRYTTEIVNLNINNFYSESISSYYY